MKKEIPGKQPSELELQVLSVLWETSEATAREVSESLPDGKKRAYTTVLSVMQMMEKKGLVTRTSEGVAHIWSATVSRNEVTVPLVRKLKRNVFGGSASAIVQQLLGGDKVSPEEIAEIRTILDEHESEGGK